MNFPNKLQHWLLALALVLTGVLFYLKVAPNRPAPANHLTSSKPIQGEPARAQVNETFGKLPLYFVENLGQVPAQAAYYVQGSDKGIYFTDQGLTFVLNGKRDEAMLQPATYQLQSDKSAKPQVGRSNAISAVLGQMRGSTK